MYKLTLQCWIEGRIGPKEVDVLVRGRWLTTAQGASIKAMDRQVQWVEPGDGDTVKLEVEN